MSKSRVRVPLSALSGGSLIDVGEGSFFCPVGRSGVGRNCPIVLGLLSNGHSDCNGVPGYKMAPVLLSRSFHCGRQSRSTAEEQL